MKLCNEDCMPICDFCKFYQDKNKNISNKFAGEGICLKKNIEVDASEFCEDDFECFQYNEESGENL